MLIEWLAGMFEYERFDPGPQLRAHCLLRSLLKRLMLKVLGGLGRSGGMGNNDRQGTVSSYGGFHQSQSGPHSSIFGP